jgi:hypothetical protein
MYDLSFIYSKRCDLRCPFCMYSSGPEVTGTLDLVKLERWLETVDMSRIASFGFYGGEVSIELPGNSRILRMLPPEKPRFVITNGSWSMGEYQTEKFLEWCAEHHMFIVVSGTPEHRKHQNRKVLEALKEEQPDAIRLKPLEEEFHPMGRLEGAFPVACTNKCMSWKRALRVAVQPDGTIIFQNCDGVYPTVGTIAQDFKTLDQRVQAMRGYGFGTVCSHYTWGSSDQIERVSASQIMAGVEQEGSYGNL